MSWKLEDSESLDQNCWALVDAGQITFAWIIQDKGTWRAKVKKGDQVDVIGAFASWDSAAQAIRSFLRYQLGVPTSSMPLA